MSTEPGQLQKFKTWRLSIPGILVATDIADQAGWGLPPQLGAGAGNVHPAILKAVVGVGRLDRVVTRLEELCEPKAEFFRHFAGILETARGLLPKYRATLLDDELDSDERKEKCGSLIKQLEDHPNADNFHRQLAMYLRTEEIERLLHSRPPSH